MIKNSVEKMYVDRFGHRFQETTATTTTKRFYSNSACIVPTRNSHKTKRGGERKDQVLPLNGKRKRPTKIKRGRKKTKMIFLSVV